MDEVQGIEMEHLKSCRRRGSRTRNAMKVSSTHKGVVFAKLVHLAVSRDIVVRFAPLSASDGRLKGKRLAIRQGLDIDNINYNLAHEIAHAFLHYDKGDTINSSKHDEFEEAADRSAVMLLCALSLDEEKEKFQRKVWYYARNNRFRFKRRWKRYKNGQL